jgi:hypothetical protein
VHRHTVAGSRLAVLAIDAPTLADPAARERARPWLVDWRLPHQMSPSFARKLAQEQSLAPDRGTGAGTVLAYEVARGALRVESMLYFTARRHRELDAMGAVLSTRPPRVVAPFIDDRYCRMLDIDPADMLVTSMHELQLQAMRSAVDCEFAALPEDLPIAERILRAHAVGLRELGTVSPLLLAGLRARFFGAPG